MANMPWFRVYSELLDDKKIKRICRATSFNKATVIGVWICLLALASESEDRGSLVISKGIPYELTDLAAETEMPDDELDKLLKMFEKYNMLTMSDCGWNISKWDNRQFKSDNSSERVAKHREKKRQEGNEVKRYSNVIDTDTDTDTESDKEEEYITAFSQITGIAYPFKVSTHAQWIQEVGEWIDLNIKREDIKAAFDLAVSKKYTVARPGSLTNFLRGNIAKNNAGSPTKSNSQIIEEMIANGEI